MALDGLLIASLVRSMKDLEGAKIGKIQNISEEEVLFHLHHKTKGTARLVINVHSNTNRMYLAKGAVEFQPFPSNFVMLLRKKISQGIITKIEQMGFDRLVRFTIEAHNELGDLAEYELYAELMGKYSNLVLTDRADGTIIDCLKRIPVFENSKRLLHPGAAYTLPEKQNKLNPLQLDPSVLDLSHTLVSQIEGFSPLLSREFIYRMQNKEDYDTILQELLDSSSLYIYGKNYHVLPMKHIGEPDAVLPVMEGLSSLYAQDESRTRIQQQCGDVFKAADREVRRLEKKLPKLEQTLRESQEFPKYQEYGDLLFCYMDEIEKEPVVEVPALEEDIWVQIPIDMRYDLKTNANLYYKKYHKLRRSQNVLKEQIAQCENDLAYYRQMQEQLKHCQADDALEIREELVRNRVLLPRKNGMRRRKPGVPHVLHLVLEDAEIFVGKNNIQNTYITHKLGRREDLWFHVKDYHGSHVLLRSENPTEEQIRMCAQLAAWFSRGKDSSSVPVDYTQIRNLKKIPGSKAGMVSMSTYRTIYIDPQEDDIKNWIREYNRRR